MLGRFVEAYAFSLAILVINLVNSALIARGFSVDEFGQYQFIRRAVNYLYPVVMLGMNMSLVRFIAYGKHNVERLVNIAYLVVASLSILLLMLTLLLFNKIERVYFYSAVMVLPVSLCMLQYAVSRGREEFQRAHWLNLLVNGLVPFVSYGICVLLDKLEFSLFISLLIMMTCFVFIIFYIFERVEKVCIAVDYLKQLYGEFLCYGFSRMTVPAFQFGLNAFGPAFFIDDAKLGLFMAAFFLVRMIEQGVAPIAIVMLPKLSSLMGKNKKNKILDYIKRVMVFSVLIGISAFFFLTSFSEFLLELIFGNGYAQAKVFLDILVYSLIPIVFVSLSQTIIDSITNKNYVMFSYFFGAGFVVGTLLVVPLSMVEYCYVFFVGYNIVAVLQGLFLFRLCRGTLIVD